MLPVISAGCKGDPTKIVFGDIKTSKDDGLLRATRRRLELFAITSGIPNILVGIKVVLLLQVS